MRHYPENIEEKLEVDQVREILSAYCVTDASAGRIAEAKPIADFDKLRRT